MENLNDILKLANIQELRSFLLEGVELSEAPDPRPYAKRIREDENRLYQFLRDTFPEKADAEHACDIAGDALSSFSDAYMEIGILAGARLLYALLIDDSRAAL